MSDTPRTDAAMYWPEGEDHGNQAVPVEFARPA